MYDGRDQAAYSAARASAPHPLRCDWAILRSIPNKLGGVCAILLVFISLLSLPWLSSNTIRSTLFRPVFECFYWLFVADCAILSWIGSQPVEEPFIIIGQGCSFFFFFFLLLCVPLQAGFERSVFSFNSTFNGNGMEWKTPIPRHLANPRTMC